MPNFVFGSGFCIQHLGIKKVEVICNYHPQIFIKNWDTNAKCSNLFAYCFNWFTNRIFSPNDDDLLLSSFKDVCQQ